jgi:hypothetical protein
MMEVTADKLDEYMKSADLAIKLAHDLINVNKYGFMVNEEIKRRAYEVFLLEDKP